MTELELDKKKQVIGLYGEMQLSMALHERGWQVHRAYIDEGIDFTITKYWCTKCQKFSNQFIKYSEYKDKKGKRSKRKCVTNLCEHCKEKELKIISRYLQIKTSEGIATSDPDIREFSFHPKIRYDMGNNVFYVWIAVFENEKEINNKICHFYIFNTKDLPLFYNTETDSYNITDNEKLTFTINKKGTVLNSSKLCFNDNFFDNFKILE